MKAIKSQLQKEVKKRGAKVLSVDVSYKADRKTCNVDGQPIFKGLFTGTNELGEIRLQARLCSDSHEQLKTPLEAFKKTQQEYGLSPVEYVFTDDPARDAQFYKETFPSLRDTQRKLDDSSPSDLSQDLSLFSFNPYKQFSVVHATDKTGVKSKIAAMMEVSKYRFLGLDTEYKVTFGQHNRVVSTDPIGCIQLGYIDKSDDIVKALLIYTGRVKRKSDGTKPNLPTSFAGLLCDPSITLTAVNLSGDISKLKADFNLDDAFANRNGKGLVDLGNFAARRRVAERSIGLQGLLGILFNKRILKNRNALFSDWSTHNPDNEQHR